MNVSKTLVWCQVLGSWTFAWLLDQWWSKPLTLSCCMQYCVKLNHVCIYVIMGPGSNNHATETQTSDWDCTLYSIGLVQHSNNTVTSQIGTSLPGKLAQGSPRGTRYDSHWREHISIGHGTLTVIAGTTILVPSHVVKSQQLIWRSGTRRFHLRVPDLQMSCRDLTER